MAKRVHRVIKPKCKLLACNASKLHHEPAVHQSIAPHKRAAELLPRMAHEALLRDAERPALRDVPQR